MKVERLQERLKQREFKLNTLLELTQAINNNLSVEGLLASYREIVEKKLMIGRLVLFTRTDEHWQCSIQYGTRTNYSELDVKESLSSIKNIELIQSHRSGLFEGFDLFIPVFHKEKPLAYLLIGDIDDDEIRVSPIIKHMHYVQTLTNIISVAIQNKLLVSKSLEQERIKTELNLAAEMQALMVNSGRRDYTDIEVATYYKPHQQVGGDFCDFIEINQDEAFFCVADVSGKGVSAAFLMANVQAHMRALLKFTDWSLESLCHELNSKVVETVKGDRFVTMFMGHFHKPSRTLTYVNAGHNPPVILTNGKTELLETGTVGIGMINTLPFVSVGTLEVSRDAVFVGYTDGVVEVENHINEEYGYENLQKLILAKAPESEHVDDLISHIINSLDVHRGKNDYFDDTALICCRFR